MAPFRLAVSSNAQSRVQVISPVSLLSAPAPRLAAQPRPPPRSPSPVPPPPSEAPPSRSPTPSPPPPSDPYPAPPPPPAGPPSPPPPPPATEPPSPPPPPPSDLPPDVPMGSPPPLPPPSIPSFPAPSGSTSHKGERRASSRRSPTPPPRQRSPTPPPKLYSLPPLPDWPPPKSEYPSEHRTFKVVYDAALDKDANPPHYYRNIIEYLRRNAPEVAQNRVKGKGPGKGKDILLRYEGEVLGQVELDGKKISEDEVQPKDPRKAQGFKSKQSLRPFRSEVYEARYEYDPNSLGPPPPTAVLVTNISPLTSNQQIRRHFSSYGIISSFEPQIDPTSGGALGIIFIRYATHEEAKRCAEKENGKKPSNGLIKTVDGEEIRVVLDGEMVNLKAVKKELEDRKKREKEEKKRLEREKAMGVSGGRSGRDSVAGRHGSTPSNHTPVHPQRRPPSLQAQPLRESGDTYIPQHHQSTPHHHHHQHQQPQLPTPPLPLAAQHPAQHPNGRQAHPLPMNPTLYAQQAGVAGQDSQHNGRPPHPLPMNERIPRHGPPREPRAGPSRRLPDSLFKARQQVNRPVANSHHDPSSSATPGMRGSHHPPVGTPSSASTPARPPSGTHGHGDSRGRSGSYRARVPPLRPGYDRYVPSPTSTDMDMDMDMSRSPSPVNRRSESKRDLEQKREGVVVALARNGMDHVKVDGPQLMTAVSEEDMREFFSDFKIDQVLKDHTGWYITFHASNVAHRAAMVLSGRKLSHHVVSVSAHPAPDAPSATTQSETRYSDQELTSRAHEIVTRELQSVFEKDLMERVVGAELRKVIARDRLQLPHEATAHEQEHASTEPKPLERKGLKGLSFKKRSKKQVVQPVEEVAAEEVRPDAELEAEEESDFEPPMKKRKKDLVKKSRKVVAEDIESEDDDLVGHPSVAIVHDGDQGLKRPMDDIMDEEEPVKKRQKKDTAKAKKGTKNGAIKDLDRVDSVVDADLGFAPPRVDEVRITPASTPASSRSPSPVRKVKQRPTRLPTPSPSPPPDAFALGLCDDDEDFYFAHLVLSGKPIEVSEPQAPPSPPPSADGSPPAVRRHVTGSARSEGFYKISHAEKAAYVTQYQTRSSNTESQAPVEEAPPQQVASSRSNRANARRRAQGLEEINQVQQAIALSRGELATSEAVKFNQLQTRKKHLKFARSPIHDWGLYAMEKISRGEMVIEYVGEVIRAQVADKREKMYERQGIGSSYLFRIDEDLVVDATKKGNLGRLINHSCDPNCTAKIITINGEKKIVIYAKQEIEMGDEITYDYHFPIEDNKIPCLCNTAKCRGYLN
ncbi:hypothetical protein HGRIS_012413 [Hohenbuehelia grisea]